MESIEETLINLLSECLPYLTSAKTNSNLPEFLKGQHAALIQKRIDKVVSSFFKDKSELFVDVLKERLTK